MKEREGKMKNKVYIAIILCSLLMIMLPTETCFASASPEPKLDITVVYETGETFHVTIVCSQIKTLSFKGVKYLEVKTESGSYQTVTFIGIQGYTIHWYLCQEDAVNMQTALNVIGTFLEILGGLLIVKTSGLSLLLVWIGAAMQYDYATIYSTDKNPDGSIDFYWDLSWYQLHAGGMLWISTNYHLWYAGLFGAWIVATYDPYPIKTRYPQGGHSFNCHIRYR